MKKILTILTCILFMNTLFLKSANADGGIKVYVDSQYLSANVLTVADRTMVPMRDICEALGYRVDWNDQDQSIMVSGGASNNIRISMQINTYSMNRLVKSNDPCQITIPLDVPPMLIDNKTYLPIRALSEALFFNVEWVAETSSVFIAKPEYQIGSTSAGEWSKLMMYSGYDPNCGFEYAGLMDLYGNEIIPYGPAPTYEEVFNRTDLMDIINEIDYSTIDIGKDGGWSSWDYRVYVNNKQGRNVLIAKYALDGTVNYVDYDVITDKGVEHYSLRSDYNPNIDFTRDSLYLREYDDKDGNRLLFNEDGSIEGARSIDWRIIDIDDVDW